MGNKPLQSAGFSGIAPQVLQTKNSFKKLE
jgi:hypothetical protein